MQNYSTLLLLPILKQGHQLYSEYSDIQATNTEATKMHCSDSFNGGKPV